MKKIQKSIAIILVSIVLTSQTSCIGSFNLTKNVYEFNREVGDIWMQELVFLVFCIVPVYEIAGFLDAVVLNSIEFWTGENPLSMSDTDINQKIVQSNNKTYQITTTKNKYNIKQLSGINKNKELNIIYNPVTSNWTASNNEKTVKLLHFHKETGKIIVYNKNEEVLSNTNQYCLNSMRFTRNN